MCDDTFGWWLRIALTLFAGGLAGYWWLMVRWQRRELREAQALRAHFLANVRALRRMLGDVEALSRDDDDASAPPLPH